MARRAWLDSDCKYAVFHRGISYFDGLFFAVLTSANKTLDTIVGVKDQPAPPFSCLVFSRDANSGEPRDSGVIRVKYGLHPMIGGEILSGLTIILLLILLMILSSAVIALRPPNSGGLRVIILISLLALTIGYFSILLIDQLYARLPQEFGGFRPRRAVLHLRAENLPNSFRDTLLRNAGRTSEAVSNSIEVLVFYADHDRFIVKIAPAPQKITRGQLRSMPAHEIRSDAVVATTYLR